MTRDARQRDARRPGIYPIGHDASFCARACVCGLGVRSPTATGQLGRAQISVIVAGAFHLRGSAGSGVVGAGALVLGNAAAVYEYRHVDDGGDRSILFDYDAATLDELAGSIGHPGAARFRAAAVPASSASVEAVALAAQAVETRDPQGLREAALSVAQIALSVERDRVPALPSLAQCRRVARALRYIEAHSAEDCSLETLATNAKLGRYHFLRVFRAITGQTPRQHVIATRLRAAAAALRATRTPVTRVGLEAGFLDPSHFTATFARAFGVSPRAYRQRAR